MSEPSTSTSTTVSSAASSKPAKTASKTARGRPTDSDDVRHSKTLSYILRHGAAKESLVLRPDGFVRVDELMKRPKLKGLDFETLQRIVKENEKQRFTLREEPVQGGREEGKLEWWIRANQGHSITVESLELKRIESAEQAPVMVHGTLSRLWPTIAKEGLSKMSRNHIHCATGLFGDAGVKSGMRSNCDLFIYLDVAKLLADDVPIYTSTNNVLLTSGKDGIVAPEYFKRVEKKLNEGETEEIDLSKALEKLAL